nr:serine/threonine-protein kinase ATG1c isoform X1 [Ipomoea batatas]
MAQSMGSRGGGTGRFMVGDYLVGKQVGTGSYSTVWHARHRDHGTEVAIKEIVTARLNSKLQESLMSEIVILRKINHPNIIHLHDMIQEPGKIYIVLEYCRGGDLSIYIQQRNGRIPEATAKHFMQQLASGLKVLRENNLIHRDLKPQNLLLSVNDDNAVLKIADFGFARSLQPRGLAETLCGSPLYMAPEIMQLQKYDAKADLWSVGAILFQLVTGKTPFIGNDQLQLLQNIVKSTGLQFPSNAKDLSDECRDLCRKLLRRNPVERLTFEEFFNHPFLATRQPDELSRIWRPQRKIDGFPLSSCNPASADESQEDCLPFRLDDDSSGTDNSQSVTGRLLQRPPYGYPINAFNVPKLPDPTFDGSGGDCKRESTAFSVGNCQLSEGNLKESRSSIEHRPAASNPEVINSLELIDQGYVIVSAPPVDSSSSTGASKLSNMPLVSGCSPQAPRNAYSRPSAPMPIMGPATHKVGCVGSLDSHTSAHGTSQGSVDIADTLEQPSTDCMRRIESLQCCASAITELVNEKSEAGKHLEAFSIQLVILAIWKQALHICHTQAASAVEGSPTQHATTLRETMKRGQGCLNVHNPVDASNTLGPQDVCSHIQRSFLSEVQNAEELSKFVEPGNTEVPDAMELIFQSALAMGRKGAVDEYMGRTENAVVFYSKAVQLLAFLQVEAPSLILNPPFSLTNTDRYRLQNYIDVLTNRKSISRSQMMALLKCEDQHCSP